MDLKTQINKIYNSEITKVGEIKRTDINEFTWGIDGMPSWLGRFDKRDLVILAGYPGSGKTEFTYFLAKENSKVGIKTLYISLELKPEDMFLRLARKKACVSKLERQDRKFTNDQYEIIDTEYKRLQDQKGITVLSYNHIPTVDDIIRTMDNYKKMGYLLFFIDNLGKIAGDNNEIVRYGDITSRLQTYKNENNICIWLLHHLSKPRKQDQYSVGGVGGIRGSQKIIDNASLVFELYRNLDPDEEDIDEKRMVKLILYKDTMDGATGTVNLQFDKGDYSLFQSKLKGK